MKKWMILSIMMGAMPLSMMAQDDMYFVPKKHSSTPQTVSTYRPTAERPVTHSGSWRNVDEYNRRGTSSYEELPADTGDVVSFSNVEGVYPDSVGDFSITRRMERWDDYEPSSDYWDGYAQGRSDSWGWHSPWYYSSYYPWYDSWYYDPWYYGYYRPWHYGWYDPWYYGWGWGGYYSSWYHRPYYHYGWYGGYAHNFNRYNSSSIGRGTRDRYGRSNGIGYDGRRETTYPSGNGRSATSGRSYGSRSSYSSGAAGTRNSSSGSYSRTNSNSRSYSGSSSSSSSRSYSGSSSSGSYSRSSGSSRSSGGSFSGGSSHSSSSRGGGGGGRSGGGRR